MKNVYLTSRYVDKNLEGTSASIYIGGGSSGVDTNTYLSLYMTCCELSQTYSPTGHTHTEYVCKAGDTMTGTLCVTSTICGTGLIRGTTICGVSCINTSSVCAQGVYADSEVVTDCATSNNTTFSTGFAGEGYKLSCDGGYYSLELDNLKVRRNMSVNELEIRKIRATNGTTWVTNGVKVTSGLTLSSGEYYFSVEAGDYNFLENDFIRAQQYADGNVFSRDYIIYSADSANSRYYVRGYDTAPAAYYSTYDFFSLTNTNMDTFGVNLNGYYFFSEVDEEEFKTADIDLDGKIGKIRIKGTWINYEDNEPWFIAEVRNSSGTLISNVSDEVYMGDESFDITLTLTQEGTTNSKIHFVTWANGYILDVTQFKIEEMYDYTIYAADVSNLVGVDFVRIGNLDNIDRQGSILITADEDNAPYISVIDGVDSTTISATDHKVRLGKLDGLTYDGNSISGYGLYAENVYLTGVINSESGSIGGWDLANDGLSSTGTNGTISLDTNNNQILFYNTSGVPKVKISTDSISTIADLTVGTSALYSPWTEAESIYAYISFSTTTGTLNTVINKYIAQYNTSSTFLQDFSSTPSSTYWIDLTANKTYSFEYSFRLTETTNITSGWSEYGYIAHLVTLTAYNSSNVELWSSSHKFVSTGNQNQTYTFKGNLGKVTTSGMYFKFSYTTSNQVGETRTYTTFLGKTQTITQYADTSTTTLFEITGVQIDGVAGQVELSKDGMIIAYDGDQYVKVDGTASNSSASPYIEMDGYEVHNGTVEFNDNTQFDSIATFNSQVVLNYQNIDSGTISATSGSFILMNGAITLPASVAYGTKLVIFNVTSGYLTLSKSITSTGIRGAGNSGATTISIPPYTMRTLILGGSYWYYDA